MTAHTKRLLVVADVVGGGTGKHLQELVRLWTASGWDVRVLAQTPPSSQMGFGDSLGLFPPRRSFDVYPLGQLRRLLWLRSYIRSWAPTVVHAYFFWSIMYGRVLKRLGVIPNLVENREDQGFGWGRHEYGLLRLTRSMPDHIVAVSQAVLNTAIERERLDPARTQVIHNGIGEAQPTAQEREATLRELGIDDGDLIVAMVSNMNRPVKGVQYFIEAIPQILQREPGARFVIFGRGAEQQTHAQRARELGVSDRLVFAGYREDMPRFYAAMDISVLTSLTEGLSIAVLESMNHGVPVVVTRVGGNPELVVDGETGFLVPAQDVPAFADKVVTLLQDPALRTQMGAAARMRIKQEFSIQNVANRYLSVYDKLTTA
jgi:glycosyltransferase involved in cell wall biosynthesis